MSKTSHHFFLILLGILSSLFSCTPKETKSPNIILIFTDDQGYNDVGVFGSPNIKTPHLDQMAVEGVRFSNFYVAQAVCSASRAAILTGTYSNRLGIHGALDHTSKHGLNPNETTIAKMLQSNGYRTAIFGKWHLGHHPEFLPTNHGFDEFYGIPYSNDMWPNHPQNPNYYPPLPLYQNEIVMDTLWNDQSMLTTWLTEKSVDFIKKSKETPFFLYLAHPMPHVPLFVSEKFKGKSERGLYGDVIMEIDWSVGEILKALKETGLDDNTLVIFLSDNGPWLSYSGHSGSADPLREGKGTSWDGGVKIPAILRWPGKIPAGLVQANPAMSIDLLPTIAAITKSNLPILPIDGKNILPMFLVEESKTPQNAYYIYYNKNELQALVMDEWKLYFPHSYRTLAPDQDFRDDGIPLDYIQMEMEKMELYHLPSDVSEINNVIGENPEILKKMIDLAEAARKDMGDALTGSKGENLREPGRVL